MVFTAIDLGIRPNFVAWYPSLQHVGTQRTSTCCLSGELLCLKAMNIRNPRMAASQEINDTGKRVKRKRRRLKHLRDNGYFYCRLFPQKIDGTLAIYEPFLTWTPGKTKQRYFPLALILQRQGSTLRTTTHTWSICHKNYEKTVLNMYSPRGLARARYIRCAPSPGPSTIIRLLRERVKWVSRAVKRFLRCTCGILKLG